MPPKMKVHIDDGHGFEVKYFKPNSKQEKQIKQALAPNEVAFLRVHRFDDAAGIHTSVHVFSSPRPNRYDLVDMLLFERAEPIYNLIQSL